MSTASGGSGSSGINNSTMGPPPNPPPQGANGHRKSSSLNRGWFEGTMEVISGMAPRPVTPSSTLRSASAPNSPARGLGMGLFGSGRNSPHHHYPPQIDRTNSGGSVGGGSSSTGIHLPSFPINRLPSQDSLDRSIHNESGHGKSTAQIVRDLKHSNSALSAKMASLEKRHMNELAQVEGASSAKRKELEIANAKQKMKLMQYEQYKAAAESKMKQQDAELSKVKEESAFQRHTISDLKNQLFQLQQELDERDDDDDGEAGNRNEGDEVLEINARRPLPLHPGHTRSGSAGSSLMIATTNSSMSTEDLQQMALDNEELVKEIQELQDQLMEYQGYDKKLKDLQRQLESAQRSDGIPPRPTTPTLHHKNNNPPERERPPLAPNKSRDQDDQDSAPISTGSSASSDESKHQALIEAHERHVQELEDRYLDLEEEMKEREVALREEFSPEVIEARVREEHQEQIEALEEQLEQYAEKLAEVAATLAESRQQAKNQEQYRQDEAEDLRMIQDAHEAEIARLETELDKATREVELRDEELEEVKQKHRSLLQQQEKEDEKKVEDGAAQGSLSESSGAELEKQLRLSYDTIKELEGRLEGLRKDRDEALAALEKDKEELLNKLETSAASSDQDTSTDLHQLWEAKTTKTIEVDALRSEIEEMRQRVQESTEALRLAEQRANNLEKQLNDGIVPTVTTTNETNNTATSDTLAQAQAEVHSSKEEIAMLLAKIQELQSLLAEKEGTENELRKAQEAVVSLDDEKQEIQNELNNLKTSMEQERSDLKLELSRRDEEIAVLKAVKTRIGPVDMNSRESGDGGKSKESAALGSSDQGELEQQIEYLKEEKILIDSKLKDRDTTIATLLRSSTVLEKKIESLEADLSNALERYEIAARELEDVKNSSVSQTEANSNANEEIRYLKTQLKVAKSDAKRWKRALKEDGTSSGEYRYQIAMLQKSNDDFAETVQERDHAIQNLVNQSMGQESHVRDLKVRISSLMKEVESVRLKKGRYEDAKLRAEIERLQDESEIFAGQIIEQDEEFKRMQRVLSTRDEKIQSLQTKIDELQGSGTKDTFVVLEKKDNEISELKKTIENLENSSSVGKADASELKNLQAELDEMQEAAESNRVELRDLRQQLWNAKQAAGSANDLRVELEQARWEFEEYKRNNKAIEAPAEVTTKSLMNDKDDELSDALEKALARIEELEVILVEASNTEAKMNEFEIELQARETIINELRAQLSAAFGGDSTTKKSEIEELNGKLNSSMAEIEELRIDIQSKDKEIAAIQAELERNTSKATEQEETAREVIDAKQNSINSLTEQVSVLQNDASGLLSELQSKTERILELEEEIRLSTRDLENAQNELNAKNCAIEELKEQLKANETKLKDASDLKLKLGKDLADNQARLGALERELSNAITETSSNEDLALKNQSLVQENASLAQKNVSLVKENASLVTSNESLMEESETLTSDNQILCQELQCLGIQNNALMEDKEILENGIQSLKTEKESLKEQNASFIREKEELSGRVVSLSEKVDELSGTISDLRDETKSLRDGKSTLEGDAQNASVLAAENKSLVEQNRSLTTTIEGLQEQNKLLGDRGEAMEKELEVLKIEMDTLSRGDTRLKELQVKLEESLKQRELSEKAIIQNYEKQMSSLMTTKDTEIDALRNGLTESREKNSDHVGEMIEQLKNMEQDNNNLRADFELELQAKDQQIFALEHTLHAQEQIVDTLKSEMDQMQSGMEHATKARRGEVEEMHQEVMQMQDKAMKQEREIVSLKMQLEERKLEHKSDVVKLKDALAKAMEEDSPLKKRINDLQNNDRMLEVRERLEQLKKRNTDLQEENLNLGGRLERAAIQINAFELEKEQADEIEAENMKLRKQLKEYEELFSKSAKTLGLSKSAPSSRQSTSEKESSNKGKDKDKKKKKFGLFKRRSIDEPITEAADEDEC